MEISIRRWILGVLNRGAIDLLVAFLASVRSATGTLFGTEFVMPQELGDHTVFGDQGFVALARERE
ncbi:hypothetical protein [Natronococcus zhouii]|uniref:hypothetical protein n=1 Tax=Natronococcus zhouii TaxID=2951804 RepID=UPI00207CA838|nr:hypothetical protein [Natronococcus sp. CG52]